MRIKLILYFVCTSTLTLVVQLEDTHAPLGCGAIVDRHSVGRTADHLPFNEERVIGQYQQGASLVCASD